MSDLKYESRTGIMHFGPKSCILELNYAEGPELVKNVNFVPRLPPLFCITNLGPYLLIQHAHQKLCVLSQYHAPKLSMVDE